MGETGEGWHGLCSQTKKMRQAMPNYTANGQATRIHIPSVLLHNIFHKQGGPEGSCKAMSFVKPLR